MTIKKGLDLLKDPTLKEQYPKYLFGDIYDWAGEIRSAGFISKGQSIFCHSDFIVPYAQSLFSWMHREDFKGMTTEQCAKRMAFFERRVE